MARGTGAVTNAFPAASVERPDPCLGLSRLGQPGSGRRTRDPAFGFAATFVRLLSFSPARAERGACSRPSNRMSGLEIDGCFPTAFRLHFVADLLAFIEALQSRTLNCTNMDEHVLAAAVRLNEAKTLRGVKPLDRS